jgi:hypothetical protein
MKAHHLSPVDPRQPFHRLKSEKKSLVRREKREQNVTKNVRVLFSVKLEPERMKVEVERRRGKVRFFLAKRQC